MKRLFTISFILLLLNAKSNAQTQFPFYGFELSNYEVGDTLEYSGSSNSMSFSNSYFSAYVFINKQTFGNDSIRYTIHKLTNGSAGSNGHNLPYYENDTIKRTITNEFVFINNNNILQDSLYNYSFPHFDTTCTSCSADTSYLKFDTTNSLKRLHFSFFSNWGISNYEAIQNIGIISNKSFTEFDGDADWSYSLTYANLNHYGTYGSYSQVIDNIKNIYAPNPSIIIPYDNSGHAILILSSNSALYSYVLTIYDLLSRPLKTMPVTTGSNPINLNNLAKGMYLYRVTSNGNILGQGKLMNL